MNLRLKLANEDKKFRPYLYAGPGFLADNGTSGMNFDAGIGAKLYTKPATAFYADLGYIHGIDATRGNDKVHDNIIKGTVGMEFDFGKTKDSDMDGVSDNKDQCPNTPTGVAVDAKGCPIDTDGDGVPDYLDDCPTVKGLTSLKGCPDSEGDGVADKDDKCPDTPKGWKVDAKGCPIDTDGDGVADAIDKCPDTPKGWKVDADGCPIDTDKDGVPDAIDECPTVPGLKEYKGCPKPEPTAAEIEAKNMKVEPIYFDTNKATFTPAEKAKVDNLIKLLKENKDYKVKLVGHTDNTGSDNLNVNLSKNRASAVAKALTAAKIDKKRILSTKGESKSSPVATNDTPEGRSKNRRTEVEVVKAK